MSNKQRNKPKPKGDLAVSRHVDYEGAPATIVRSGAHIVANIAWETLPRPPHRFSVDWARVVMQRGQPEIHLVQTDPFNDTQVRRVVVVRYERNRFKERARQNEVFRGLLEEFLVSREDRGLPGELSGPEMFEKLDATAGHDSVKIDAEAEWLFRRDHWCHAVFVSMYGRDIHRVTEGHTDVLPIQPIIEAVMPCRVLADLMLAWKNLAEGIAK